MFGSSHWYRRYPRTSECLKDSFVKFLLKFTLWIQELSDTEVKWMKYSVEVFLVQYLHFYRVHLFTVISKGKSVLMQHFKSANQVYIISILSHTCYS